MIKPFHKHRLLIPDRFTTPYDWDLLNLVNPAARTTATYNDVYKNKKSGRYNPIDESILLFWEKYITSEDNYLGLDDEAKTWWAFYLERRRNPDRGPQLVDILFGSDTISTSYLHGDQHLSKDRPYSIENQEEKHKKVSSESFQLNLKRMRNVLFEPPAPKKITFGNLQNYLIKKDKTLVKPILFSVDAWFSSESTKRRYQSFFPKQIWSYLAAKGSKSVLLKTSFNVPPALYKRFQKNSTSRSHRLELLKYRYLGSLVLGGKPFVRDSFSVPFLPYSMPFPFLVNRLRRTSAKLDTGIFYFGQNPGVSRGFVLPALSRLRKQLPTLQPYTFRSKPFLLKVRKTRRIKKRLIQGSFLLKLMLAWQSKVIAAHRRSKPYWYERIKRLSLLFFRWCAKKKSKLKRFMRARANTMKEKMINSYHRHPFRRLRYGKRGFRISNAFRHRRDLRLDWKQRSRDWIEHEENPVLRLQRALKRKTRRHYMIYRSIGKIRYRFKPAKTAIYWKFRPKPRRRRKKSHFIFRRPRRRPRRKWYVDPFVRRPRRRHYHQKKRGPSRLRRRFNKNSSVKSGSQKKRLLKLRKRSLWQRKLVKEKRLARARVNPRYKVRAWQRRQRLREIKRRWRKKKRQRYLLGKLAKKINRNRRLKVRRFRRWSLVKLKGRLTRWQVSLQFRHRLKINFLTHLNKLFGSLVSKGKRSKLDHLQKLVKMDAKRTGSLVRPFYRLFTNIGVKPVRRGGIIMKLPSLITPSKSLALSRRWVKSGINKVHSRSWHDRVRQGFYQLDHAVKQKKELTVSAFVNRAYL